jgi:hypothetical protein
VHVFLGGDFYALGEINICAVVEHHLFPRQQRQIDPMLHSRRRFQLAHRLQTAFLQCLLGLVSKAIRHFDQFVTSKFRESSVGFQGKGMALRIAEVFAKNCVVAIVPDAQAPQLLQGTGVTRTILQGVVGVRMTKELNDDPSVERSCSTCSRSVRMIDSKDSGLTWSGRKTNDKDNVATPSFPCSTPMPIQESVFDVDCDSPSFSCGLE